MNTQELAQYSKEELITRLREARERLYDVREQVLSGKEKNHAQLAFLRRDVARICSLLQKHL